MEFTPVLKMVSEYPKEVEKLITDPLATAVEELEKASKSGDWIHVDLASKLLAMVVRAVSE